MRARVAIALGLGILVGCGSTDLPAPQATPLVLDIPGDLPGPAVPRDNPLTVEGVALGRRLFYDVRLSGNQTQACASCHEQARAFTDGRARAEGSTGQMTPRGSMSLTNVGYYSVLTWANPLIRQLEDQALLPMFGEDPVELGLAGKEQELLARIRDDDEYPSMFAAAYPAQMDPISLDNLVKAIASFQRTLVSFGSPYDRYFYARDTDALSDAAFRGLELFFSEQLECFHCHGGFNFAASTTHESSTFQEIAFHNNGLYDLDGTGAYPPGNQGIFEITAESSDRGRFKAPSLRNIEVTAPYMHDGSLETLEDVIDHYARGGTMTAAGPNAGDGKNSPLKDGFVNGFTLTDDERSDLLAFLRALTDRAFLENPELSSPFE